MERMGRVLTTVMVLHTRISTTHQRTPTHTNSRNHTNTQTHILGAVWGKRWICGNADQNPSQNRKKWRDFAKLDKDEDRVSSSSLPVAGLVVHALTSHSNLMASSCCP